MRGNGSVGGGRWEVRMNGIVRGGRCEGMGLWEVVGAREWVCGRW